MKEYELFRSVKSTDEEIGAVLDYTGNDYRQINRYLRTGQFINEEKVKNLVKNIDNVMETNPVKKNLTTFRHLDIDSNVAKNLFGVNSVSQIKKGSRFLEKGYSSTSFSSTKTKGFGEATIVYKIKKGGKAHGFAIDDKSRHKGEMEFIVSRGATGTVRRVSNKSGRLVIEIDID